MHMSDALLSPVVGGAFWVASGALIAVSAKKITDENDHRKTPLMGVLGAFVFAAQMINFTIPGTGSSGHLGGGLLLAVMLGPWRAFITLASVLIIQCLFFADGGLLALGCNIFNLAFFPAFVAFPFIYSKIAGNSTNPGTIGRASISAATAGLLMGAFSVVIQTVLSGITELPFTTFTLFMLPVHLAIGIVEGLVTWGVLAFVARTEPALLPASGSPGPKQGTVLASLAIAALLTGGLLSWFASSDPDGLEWSMAKTTGSEEFAGTPDAMKDYLAGLQEKTAFLPDYGFRAAGEPVPGSASPVSPETSVSGIVGSLAVVATAWAAGVVLGRKRRETGTA